MVPAIARQSLQEKLRLPSWPLPEKARLVPSLERIAELLRGADVDWTRLATRIHYSPERYVREMLARTAACELVLICWLPSQATVVHDHQGSIGASLVLAGELSETRFRARRTLLEHVWRQTFWSRGVLVEEPDTIHQVFNSGEEPALSLHFYAPPLRRVVEHPLAKLARMRPPAPRVSAS